MTKKELLSDEAFKSAPDNAVMAYVNAFGGLCLLGEPTRCYKSVIRFTQGIGITKGELLESSAFNLAKPNAELEVEMSDCVLVFLFVSVSFENEYLKITDKI